MDSEPPHRLKTINSLLKKAKNTSFPLFALCFLQAVGSLFGVMANYLMKKCSTAALLTNFPGPGIDINFQGKRALAGDFATGTQGAVGIGFMLLSFRNHIRIAVTVEEGILSRNESKQLLKYVTEEIDNLYELSMRHDKLLNRENELSV